MQFILFTLILLIVAIYLFVRYYRFARNLISKKPDSWWLKIGLIYIGCVIAYGIFALAMFLFALVIGGGDLNLHVQ